MCQDPGELMNTLDTRRLNPSPQEDLRSILQCLGLLKKRIAASLNLDHHTVQSFFGFCKPVSQVLLYLFGSLCSPCRCAAISTLWRVIRTERSSLSYPSLETASCFQALPIVYPSRTAPTFLLFLPQSIAKWHHQSQPPPLQS